MMRYISDPLRHKIAVNRMQCTFVPGIVYFCYIHIRYVSTYISSNVVWIALEPVKIVMVATGCTTKTI